MLCNKYNHNHFVFDKFFQYKTNFFLYLNSAIQSKTAYKEYVCICFFGTNTSQSRIIQ